MNLAAHINEQAKTVNLNPSEPQKKYGNYKKGHVKVHGLDISIENPRGSWRSGVADGKPWKSRLPNHYGYIRKSESGDGDHLDVYLGPHLKSPHVFVIDQHELGSKQWDEHKAFIGFGSKVQAREAYHHAFSDERGKDRIGHIETMTVPEFKSWLAHGETTRPIKSHRKGYADGGAAFGTQTPQELGEQEPNFLDRAVASGINGVATLPRRAIENSQHSLDTGTYDPGPTLEAAMLPMGTGAIEGAPVRAGETVLGAGPIRAYHGSPHDFDKFSMDKIGTGDGAQAYGHGMYFAENEGVAKAYRDALSGKNMTLDGSKYNTNDPMHNAAAVLDKFNGDREAALKWLDGSRIMKPTYDALKSGAELPKVSRPSHMYEVNINADPEHFLDWDKPLNQQHPRVQDALAKHDPDMYHPLGGDYDATELGQSIYHRLNSQGKTDILKQSAPGIKYLDQGSRGAGEGSRNYVVFNDKLIDILKKYGIAGAAATTMANEIMDQGKHHFASGGRVHMAEGGAPNPFDQIDTPKPSGGNPFDAVDAPKPQEPDAGIASYLPKAITDIPHEAYEATANQARNIGHAWSNIRERHAAQAEKDKGPSGSFFDPAALLGSVKDIGDTGSAVASAATLPIAPFLGGAQSLVGHPMADAEHIVGGIINPQVAAHDDPQKMYDTAKQDVSTAVSAARPKGPIIKGPSGVYQHASQIPPAPIVPQSAANVATADEFGIKLSRGQATGDLDTIRYEDMAARGAYGPEAQKRAAEFFDQQFKDSQAGGQSVGQQTARGAPVADNPADAAAAINTDVADRAARARALQGNVDQQAAAEAESQRGIVSDQGRAIDESIRGAAQPIAGPREAGEVVGQNVRDAAATNRADFRARYDEFGGLPGEFRADAVKGIGTRIRNDLSFSDSPIIVDDQLTPAASRAIQALDEMSVPRIQNRASAFGEPNPDEIAGVNLRGIDQMRKKLVAYYQASRANPTDARATQGILHAFDGQIERAITEGLFSGDPRALEALQEARASYSRYRQTFGPQRPGDDVGTAMRRIVDRNATPEETANMIIGSGKIGSAGLPVRIADRLEQVLGADSDSWSAIRQAMWQKASQVRNATGGVDPAKSAASISDFTGSTLARRMFTPQELSAMRSHARGIQELDRNIEQMPITQTANRVREVYQDVFGGKELGGVPKAAFQRMVDGTATPEEIANGVFKVIGAGNPGHVTRALQAIERIVGENSPAMGAVRQGVWQKLTQAAAGKDQPGAQKAMQAINEFLNGSGKTIAQQLYSPQELALMDRYQKALKLTIIPKYARTNSDTAPAMLAAVRKYAGMIGSALGFAAEHGSPGGGLQGYAVGKLLDKAGEKFLAARQSKKLNDTFSNVVPPPVKPVSPPNLKSARMIPLSLHGGPSANIGAALARLQGPAPGYANQEQQQP